MAKRWLIGGETYVLASNYDAAEARIRELEEERDNALHKAKPMEAALKIASTHLKRIAELEAENARLISDGLQSAAYIIEMRDLRSRIREGERLFKKMLMMSGSELGGPHPIWADVERWLGDPPGSQSDSGEVKP